MLKFFMSVLLAALISVPLNAYAKSQTLQIDGDHGKLSAVLQTPDKSPYPLVIICHGFTSSKDDPIMVSLANKLEAAGIASIRFDFNGHGSSEGNFQDMTVLNEISDAIKVYNYAVKLPTVTGVALAGHSQGGVVASMTAGQLGAAKIKALALMAPAAVLREDAIRGNIFTEHYDAVNPPETVEIFNGLKLGRNYILTAQTLPIYETAEKYKGPALMVHGTGDIVVPYTYSLRYQKIYPDSKLELLPKFDHGFTQDVDKATQIVADYFAEKLK